MRVLCIVSYNSAINGEIITSCLFRTLVLLVGQLRTADLCKEFPASGVAKDTQRKHGILGEIDLISKSHESSESRYQECRLAKIVPIVHCGPPSLTFQFNRIMKGHKSTFEHVECMPCYTKLHCLGQSLHLMWIEPIRPPACQVDRPTLSRQ